MNNVKSLAVAVAAAIGAAGVGVAQADEVLFPYAVSSNTVATILSVVNLYDPTNLATYSKSTAEADKLGSGATNYLHFRYWTKSGTASANPANDAECVHNDAWFNSSPNDLLDVSVDDQYGSKTRGVLFNDPAKKANYEGNYDTLSLMSVLERPARAFVIVDNNNLQDDTGVGDPRQMGADKTLVAARATIIEFINGAAWGYAAYNPINPNSQVYDYGFESLSERALSSGTDLTDVGGLQFGETQERYGEVFGGVDPTTVATATPRSVSHAVFSFKPFADGIMKTTLSITPIAGLNTFGAAGYRYVNSDGDTVGDGKMGQYTQNQGNLQTTVYLAADASFDTGSVEAGFVAYNRDELKAPSGRVPHTITCVGSVKIDDFMREAARDALKDTGGWGLVRTTWPSVGASSGSKVLRTNEAMILFLEYKENPTQGGLNGELLNGVINNGFLLQE